MYNGISIKTQRFGQKALAFAVTHSTPHKNISTEIHNSGGPFTLVPLPDFNGKPSSAIVWMENGEIKIRQEAVEEMRKDLKDVIKEVKEMIAERADEV